MSWQVETDGPRRYSIEVEGADFALATRKDGGLISYGDENLVNLNLGGKVQYLNADNEVTAAAEPEMGEDMVVRSFTVGTTADFVDEDDTGEKVALKGRQGPRTRFDGGKLVGSMIELAGTDWLEANIGEWNVAANWAGLTLIIQPTPRTDDGTPDGKPVFRPGTDDNGNRRQEIDTVVVGVGRDGNMVGESVEG